MIHVIVYDITKDPLRTQVSKRLVALGTRVQKSVFELDLHPSQIPSLLIELRAIIEEGDSLRCYPLCAACQHRAESQNPTPLAVDVPFYQI
jgi:CRISPR-associated endonuclease Cas2